MAVSRPIRVAALAVSPVFYQVPLYRRLAAAGVDLTVIYASDAGVRPYDAAFGGRKIAWDVDLLGGYRSRFLKRARENDVLGGFFGLRDWDVVRELRRGDFDAVWIHGYSYLTQWLAIFSTILRRRELLVREEQTLLRSRRAPKRWIRALVLRALFSRAHGLYIGSNNRAFFERYGLRDERLSFVPYCVDNGTLQGAAEELRARAGALREEFELAAEGPVVLFVGKLTPKKRPDVLLEAFALVRGDHPCSLLFVGEGPLEGELRARIARDGIPDVRFAGFLNRSEIGRAYAAADVFVLPSDAWETWGLVVNEAMNFELPVVVSDEVGSARDLVQPGVNGFIVDGADAAALAEALGRLVADGELRRRYGAASLRIVGAWDYDAAAAGIVRALDLACGRNGRASL